MRRTDLAYDAFGRLTGVWLPNRPKAASTASMIFSYLLSKTVPNVVATQELLPNGSYKTSRTLFDGLLRQRQVQTPAANGVGRVIDDTNTTPAETSKHRPARTTSRLGAVEQSVRRQRAQPARADPQHLRRREPADVVGVQGAERRAVAYADDLRR